MSAKAVIQLVHLILCRSLVFIVKKLYCYILKLFYVYTGDTFCHCPVVLIRSTRWVINMAL